MEEARRSLRAVVIQLADRPRRGSSHSRIAITRGSGKHIQRRAVLERSYRPHRGLAHTLFGVLPERAGKEWYSALIFDAAERPGCHLADGRISVVRKHTTQGIYCVACLQLT